MNKGYLEALECLEKAKKVLTKIFGKEALNEDGINFDTIEQSLKCLESIDNSNPSEALENIGNIDLGDNPYKTFEHNKLKNVYKSEFNIVKQALLKQQEPRIIVLDEKGFDGSWENSEEGKKRLAEIKELLKDKDLGDYTNTSMPPVNYIYIPKKYLKWEDLDFKEESLVEQMKVKLGDNIYHTEWFKRNDYKVVNFYTNVDDYILHYTSYGSEEDNKFFNDLHLERAEE